MKALSNIQNKLLRLAPYLLVLATLLHVYSFVKFADQGHDWGGDFALYISQAEALSDGSTEELAAINRESMLVSYKRNGPDLYPPGYPLMLYPLVEFFGRNFVLFKSLNVLYFIAAIFLLIQILARYFKKEQAYYFGAFIVVHPFFLGFNHEVISDVPALFFALLAWHLYEQWKTDRKPWQWMVVGLVLGFGVLIKSLVITLVGAVVLVECITWLRNRTSYRLLSLVSLVLSTALTVFLSGWLYPSSSSSYMEQLMELTPDRLYNNFIYNIWLPKEFLFQSDLLYYLFAFLFMTGLISAFRRSGSGLFYWFLLAHLLLLVIWPFHEGPRFMFVLFPVIGFFFLQGVRYWSQWKSSYVVTLFCVTLFLHLPFHVFPITFGAAKTSYSNEAANEDALALYAFIEAKTADEDKLVFFKPRVIRFYTGRQAYIIEDREQALQSAARWYIRFEPWGGFEVDGFEQVFSNPTFTVFDMQPE